jgi:hypothetical protein
MRISVGRCTWHNSWEKKLTKRGFLLLQDNIWNTINKGAS